MGERMKANKLIFSPWFEHQGLVVNYLDVGARGDVSEPWSLFKSGAINVIGFEPDPEECERLSKVYSNRKYYPNALWGETTTRAFHLCEWASTSSMYPPSQASNLQYQSTNWIGRVTAKTLQVECVALDSVLSREDAPDFIKLDTQGAELEILRGSERLLMDGSPLILAETWCAEIYAGMPLAHDVMAFMYRLGYQVFDLNIAAAWKHKNAVLSDVYCKAKTIGFDLLFIKRLDQLNFKAEPELLKFAGLCELYGFRDYAIATLESTSLKSANINEALKQLVENDRQDRLARRSWKLILNRLFGYSTRLWPHLH
jgi:FkbM family methyltransferase